MPSSRRVRLPCCACCGAWRLPSPGAGGRQHACHQRSRQRQHHDAYDGIQHAPGRRLHEQGRQKARAISKRREPREAGEFDFTLDPRKDEPSEIGMSFCTFLAFTKFPYKYVDKAFSQPITSSFFDGGKIFNKSWDL